MASNTLEILQPYIKPSLRGVFVGAGSDPCFIFVIVPVCDKSYQWLSKRLQELNWKYTGITSLVLSHRLVFDPVIMRLEYAMVV